MPLNPFFLSGSKGEQGLIQDLINEQIKMYGVDVHYIPRKFLTKNTVIREVIESQYDSAFPIEAYISNSSGFGGQGTLLSKFGIAEVDDLTLVISREVFELYMTPLMKNLDDIELATRPKEGDLIFFPLGDRLFEIKYVEHEQPFYQLKKNYVYELRCEPFRYGNEVIDTSIDSIDRAVEDEGVITSLRFVGAGRTATALVILGKQYVNEVFLNNDGYGYVSPPNVTFSSPTASGGFTARGFALTTSTGSVSSVYDIVLISAGAGYSTPPTITISGGGGTGAAATASVVGSGVTGIIGFQMIDRGEGYINDENVTVTVTDPNDIHLAPGAGVTAVGIASVKDGKVVSINIVNSGIGYTGVGIPTDIGVTISSPRYAGFGTFMFNEIVTGQTSGVEARVKSWDSPNRILKVSNVSSNVQNVLFYPGEIVVGSSSSAYYKLEEYDSEDIGDPYAENEEIEIAADAILDFSESNPFGNY